MNDDLINREDLKRKLQYVYSCDYIASKSKEGIVSDIIDKINTALDKTLHTLFAARKFIIICHPGG